MMTYIIYQIVHVFLALVVKFEKDMLMELSAQHLTCKNQSRIKNNRHVDSWDFFLELNSAGYFSCLIHLCQSAGEAIQ